MLLHTYHSRHWRFLYALLVIACGLMIGGYNNMLSANVGVSVTTEPHTSTPRMANCHLQNNLVDGQGQDINLIAAECCEWLCSTHAILPVSLALSIRPSNPQFEDLLNQNYIQSPQMAYRRAIERPPRLSA